MYADAFLDDPGWIAIGPRDERRRWQYIRRTALSVIRVADRWCGPSWCVVESDEPRAALVGCAPGKWPPPQLQTLLRLSPGPALAGPGPLVRSLIAERVFERMHPEYDHFLVWMLAVSPAHQRRGLGGRLMAEAIAESERADVPAYLWTAKPDNVPYYHSHGYRTFAEAKIPRDINNWFMLRQPGAGGEA